MTTLNVFQTDAFGLQSLTAAILKAPYKPARLGQLRLFGERGISTVTVMVEEKNGQLTLISTSPRGAPGDTIGRSSRTARSFACHHLVREAAVYADEVQGVRAFGSENEAEVVQTIVDERLAMLRAMHEVTLEWHRMGALKGVIYDADGTTVLYNLFTEFGVSQQTLDFALDSDETDVRAKCVATRRLIEDELGASTYTGLRGFCSATFFDSLIGHPSVKGALQYQEGRVLLQDLGKSSIVVGGITWEEYMGGSLGVDFVESDYAYVFPEGVMTVQGPLFQTVFAPADYMETVNTLGLPIYAKSAPDPSGMNKHVKIESQSNPLSLCFRPRSVIKVSI